MPMESSDKGGSNQKTLQKHINTGRNKKSETPKTTKDYRGIV